MNENKQYNINLETIKSSFKMKDGDLTHTHNNKFKLLPYVANDKKLVLNLKTAIGAFSRIISKKELKGEFNYKEFIENVLDQIGDFEGENSTETLRDIVEKIFIDKESLVNFDIKTINYITSTKPDEKIANFLYSIFINEELNELVSQQYNDGVDNVLYKLVLNALPKLEEKQYSIKDYNCYLPFIKDLFIKDFKFLIEDEDLYKNSLRRFVEYYYMFYLSQLSIKLDSFEKADINKPETIYYTLDWESTSRNRTAHKFGWNVLKNNVNDLFSHAITLELLNHNELEGQYNYVELLNLFDLENEKDIANQINEVYKLYRENMKSVNWKDFKGREEESENIAFNKVYKLFDAVKYQFNKSSRSRANEAYSNWYRRFVYENFAKRRGPLGYNLNLKEEDIILMTKICINHNSRLKLSVLFDEFEKRGMFFDRNSQIEIIELYERLNLLEKKSDSGDAQYVRSVL